MFCCRLFNALIKHRGVRDMEMIAVWAKIAGDKAVVKKNNERGCWRYEKKSLILRLTRPKETTLFVALR